MCQTIDEVIETINYWDEKRHDLPYDTDGMVIKVNSFDDQEVNLAVLQKILSGLRL